MRSRKVILDTNLWVSFLITRDMSFLDEYVESGKVKLIFSKELIEEFIAVASRPKFENILQMKTSKTYSMFSTILEF